MSYAHLLSILINVREIVPKEIKPSRFPYYPKLDLNVTCGYHVGHVGNSTEACCIPKNKVEELFDQKMLCFTDHPQE